MIAWTVEALVASAILMVLVLVLRRPVSQAFGARAAYALWALPVLRMLLPPLPGWHALLVPVARIGDHSAELGLTDTAQAATILTDLPAAHAAALPAAAAPFPWGTALIAAWLIGAALFFGWQMLRYRLFLARALRSATRLTRECGVEILLTEAVDGPVAAGIVNRRIFLPADFLQRYGQSERRLALLHEGAHHDRRDILANLLALGVLSLHWFNPLAHRAYRLFRADQELACDETVLADIGAAERYAYGSAVVKSAAARMPGVACALGHRAELKQRLRSMARPLPGVLRARTGFGLAVAAIGAGLIATASGHAAQADAGLSPADIAQIHADADEARREGLRAAEEGRREAAEGRREAMQARDEGRREATQARDEARREAAEARMEAAQGRIEAARGREEAARERAEAARERETAHGSQASYGQTVAQREIAHTRQEMAAQCAAKGRPVSPDLDWSRLALCGDTGASISARVHAQVHDELARQGIE